MIGGITRYCPWCGTAFTETGFSGAAVSEKRLAPEKGSWCVFLLKIFVLTTLATKMRIAAQKKATKMRAVFFTFWFI